MSQVSFAGVSDVLHDVLLRTLDSLCTNGEAAAFILPDGEALLVRPAGPADLGTLPQVASLCHRYLKLNDGDLAIANDPYSGGTVLNEFTLVMGLKVEGPGGKAASSKVPNGNADLLLVRRILTAPRLNSNSKLDAEGVRVPPTPLATREMINDDLLKAISGHPLAPHDFAARMKLAAQEMFTAAACLRRLARDPATLFRSANFKQYLQDSARAFEALMVKIPLGTALGSYQFSTGETLKLQVRTSEELIQFDFAGSETSNTIAMTEVATFGACMAALASRFDEAMPFNAGTFQHVQVSAPQKTMLSSAPPIGTLRGMTEGAAAVAQLAYEVLAKLTAPLKAGESAGSHLQFCAKFKDGRIFSLELPHGMGASIMNRSHGANAATIWAARGRTPGSIEQIEENWPLTVLTAGERASSGGEGKIRGGHGAVFGCKFLEGAEVFWSDPSVGRKHDGASGGRSGTPASIEIRRSPTLKPDSKLGPIGTVQIQAGDEVYLMTSGGGGFGEIAKEAKESEGT